MNVSAEITRKTDDACETQGQLIVLDENGANTFSCVTLERPWKDNQQGISCIPSGFYIVKKVPATEHIKYPHFELQNVLGRTGVCIHILNKYFQSLGCIGVGESYGDINADGESDLLNSKKTFDTLYAIMPDEFKLVIK